MSLDLEYGLANYTNESSTISSLPGNDTSNSGRYLSSLGVWLAIPEWEAAVTAITLSLIIVLTVVGNILVILSVFTYRPLRSAPNFFIVSLAVADMTVAILVLPLNVAYTILGRWVLGKIICEFWVTSDVLCCTGECVLFNFKMFYLRETLRRCPVGPTSSVSSQWNSCILNGGLLQRVFSTSVP